MVKVSKGINLTSTFSRVREKSYLNFLTCERETFLWFVSERKKCVGFIPSLLNRSRSLQILEFTSFSILLDEKICRSHTVLFRDIVHIFIHDQCKYVCQRLSLNSPVKKFPTSFPAQKCVVSLNLWKTKSELHGSLRDIKFNAQQYVTQYLT